MSGDRVERFPASECYACHQVTDARFLANVSERGPVQDDCSVCMYCTSLSIFTVGLTLRRPTVFEETVLLNDPVVQAIVQQVRAMRVGLGWLG